MRGFVSVASLVGILAISAPAFAVETNCFEVEKVTWVGTGSKVSKTTPYYGKWDFKTPAGINLTISCAKLSTGDIKKALMGAVGKGLKISAGPTVGTEEGNKVAHVVGTGTFKGNKVVIAKVVSYLTKSKLTVSVTIRAPASKADEVEKLMGVMAENFEAASLAEQAKMLAAAKSK